MYDLRDIHMIMQKYHIAKREELYYDIKKVLRIS